MRPSYTIAGGGLTASFTDLGAVLADLRLDGVDHPLVLGLADLDHYPEFSNYMGATAGRFANRIGNARFPLDGREYRTDPNFGGAHTLHGGSAGTGKRVWTVEAHGADRIRFSIDLADGEMGFPGAMRIWATYVCQPDAVLRVDYEATSDAPTICNLAHHTYWNLDGTDDVSGHYLTVRADRYVEVDGDMIPTGVAPVAGTAFDFRAGLPLPGEGLLDHNLCLSDGRVPLREVAVLHARGLSMALATTEPGLQVYDGAKLATQVPGIGGRTYGKYAGVALEAQLWPDAPNHPGFPDGTLRPGETYHQTTTFTFRRG